MRAASVKLMVRRALAVFVLLLTVCHASPRAARAGCGHLVSSSEVYLAQWNQPDRLIVGDSAALVSARPLYPDQLPVRRPCSGLSCSSKEPVSSSTASQTTGEFDHWGDLITVLLDQAIVPTGTTIDASAA